MAAPLQNQLDFRFGTPMHGLKRFGEDALSRFLDDLDSLAQSGLTKGQCDHVKEALREIGARTATLPADSFIRRMWDKFPPFLTAYQDWNERDDQKGLDAQKHRREKRLALKRSKAALYQEFHSDQWKLQEELANYSFVDSLYKPFERLVGQQRGLFPELENAIARWRRFRPSSENPHPRLQRLTGTR
jgi:hypothetical protein